MALFVAFPFSAVAESQMKLDCTIGYFNKLWKKELEHAYGTGYSTTKVAPKDIEWVWPGDDPIRRRIFGFVIGWCKKGNITNDTELQNVMIKLNKLASDHGRTLLDMRNPAWRYAFSFSDYKTHFLISSNAGNKTTLHQRARIRRLRH